MNITMINNKRTSVLPMIVCALLFGGVNSVNAQLPEDSLDVPVAEVQVLYGSKPEHELSSSVSTLDSKSVTPNSVVSFGNALYGRIPGLFVQQSSGVPGEDAPTLYIRGKHTYTGSNAPLVLIDGLPRDLNTLSLEEVESVSVLKDAAATALYGADGANGIILVTTKRGVIGKPQISFKAELGMMLPTELPEFYGSYDYANFYNMAERNDGKTSFRYSQEDLERYKTGYDSQLYPDVNWVDAAVREMTPTQSYAVDVKGGNEVARYYVNLGYTGTEGIFKEIGNKTYDSNNSLSRFNFRSNIDVDIVKGLRMNADIAGRLENLNAPYNTMDNIWGNLYTYHPNAAPIYAAPGVWGGSNIYRTNPLAYINDMGYRHTHRRLLQMSIGAQYDFSGIMKGLSLGLRAAFDNYYSADNGYSKTFGVMETLGYNEKTQTYQLSPLYGKNTALTAFGPENEQEKKMEAYEFWASYERRIEEHSLGAFALFHAHSQSQYLSSDDLKKSPDRRVTAGLKLSYDYRKTYFLEAVATCGASGFFMEGERYGFFPAASAAWVISNENFMKSVSAIDLLKLRVSGGLVGNQNVGGRTYGYRNEYLPTGGGWGVGTNNGGYGGGYAEAAVANPYLTWEKALKIDAGFDMVLWKNLSLGFTYFHEYRTDILNSGDNMFPGYMGASFGYLNYGEVQSQGIEAMVSFEKQYRSWGFNAGINLTHQKNKVLRMGETPQRYEYLYKQGNAIGAQFGYLAEGYYSAEDVTERDVRQTFGKVIPGSLKYADINGDKIVDTNDKVLIGKNADVPEWEMGVNLGINFRGFYANAFFQACMGRDVNMRTAAPYATSPLYDDRNISTYIKQPWTAEAAADPALAAAIDFPSLSIENANNTFQQSSFFMKNGDFIRLRSLEIGYQFPKKWIKHLRMQNAGIYLRGMNLFTWDHIEGYDPEVLEGYPVMKSYNIGVNITF